jgi:hypothetical protein
MHREPPSRAIDALRHGSLSPDTITLAVGGYHYSHNRILGFDTPERTGCADSGISCLPSTGPRYKGSAFSHDGKGITWLLQVLLDDFRYLQITVTNELGYTYSFPTEATKRS